MITVRFYHKYLTCLLITNIIAAAEPISYGIIVVPVADLMGEQLSNIHEYSQLPLSASGEPWRVCPRIHQLLFNEMVIIEKKDRKQYCIRTPHLFFITPTNNHPMNLYWIHQDNIVPLSTLSSYHVAPETFPQPFGQKNINGKTQEIITLLKPFYDETTRQTYSAGTRFVLSSPQNTELTTLSVWIFDRHSKSTKKILIPKSHCAPTNIHEEPDQQIKKFVQIVKEWAHLENGFIPYVWGGCSFQVPHILDEIEIKKSDSVKNSPVEMVMYKKKHHTKPKDGCDCAGLVVRAAQAAGIPYFYKNTYTLSRFLKPVLHHVKEGDLIWIPGHVLIVADLKRNTIIEARDFSDGYGKVHEIHLDKVFKDMHTFDDLMTAFREHRPLTRLNHPLGKTKEYETFKILSMESLWDTKKIT